MLKKTLRAAVICGVAFATAVGFTGSASATEGAADAPVAGQVAQVADIGDVLDVPDVNIGNDLCLLPWFWPGPFNIGTEDQTGYYSACNGGGSSTGEGINILNNACVAPWLWQGPINFLTKGQDSYYEACNNVSGSTVFANALMQYMTIDYMIAEGMLDEAMFEAFLQGEVSAHEVILDDGVHAEFQIDRPDVDAIEDGGLFDNACILPWLWQGPLNFLTQGQTAHYAACNG